MKRKSYKLIVASVGISAFLAVGSVYAQSNAGLILQDWYKTKSHQLTGQIHTNVVQGLKQAAQRVKHSSAGLAGQTDNDLSKTLDDSSKDAAAGIQSAGKAYASQMDQTVNELSQVIKDQTFDPYIRTKTSENNDELEQLVETAIKQLTQQLDGSEAPAGQQSGFKSLNEQTNKPEKGD